MLAWMVQVLARAQALLLLLAVLMFFLMLRS